ncbi:hypothetical protein QOT17_002777 [Balamuthia mandrillaris]
MPTKAFVNMYILYVMFSCTFVSGSFAITCAGKSWSTDPPTPAPGQPFVLTLSVLVKEANEPPCEITLGKSGPYTAWATDRLKPSNVPLGLKATCDPAPQLNHCIVRGTGGGIVSFQRQYNVPLTAVQPDEPLRYFTFDGTHKDYYSVDIQIRPSFSLTATFTSNFPSSYVPGRDDVFPFSFQVSSSGPSLVNGGFCLLAFTPRSSLDRLQLPGNCGDGPEGTIRCNFRNSPLPPATSESFAFKTLVLGAEMRETVTVAVPSCNNNAGNELKQYTPPTPQSMRPSPDIQLSLALLNSGASIRPGGSIAIRFKLGNKGISTSLSTSLDWTFPLDIKILDTPFTQSFCSSSVLADHLALTCTLNVKPGEEERQIEVELAAGSTLSVVGFSIRVKDELQKETATNGQLIVAIPPTLEASFTKDLPASFVPGQGTPLQASFNVSNRGAAMVREGYCVVSFSPLSVLDREALPSTCGDGGDGKLRCGFQHSSLPPASFESFSFQTLPLPPAMRDNVVIAIPTCGAADETIFTPPTPQSSQPSPNIQLAFALLDEAATRIVAGGETEIQFKLCNRGPSTSLATSMTWHFPLDITLVQNAFTQAFCKAAVEQEEEKEVELSCQLDVGGGGEVEKEIAVRLNSGSSLAAVEFSVELKDELGKELPKVKGELTTTTLSNKLLMNVEWLQPSTPPRLHKQESKNNSKEFAVEMKSGGPSWARQVECFFNFTILDGDGASSLADSSFTSPLPCTALLEESAEKHVLCQVGDLSTSTWTSFRFALSSKQPLAATKVEIGCRSSTPNHFPLISWSAVLGEEEVKPSIDPGAGETASQFPDNTPNLQLVPKQGTAPQEHLRLDFVFHSIRELDGKGEEVRKMSFPSSGYHSSFLDERTIAFLWEVEEDEKKEEGRKGVEWRFTVVEEEKEFHVGNRTFKVGAGFTKWSVLLSGWADWLSSSPSRLARSEKRIRDEEGKTARWLELIVRMNSSDSALIPADQTHLREGRGDTVVTNSVWRTDSTQVTLNLLQVCLVDGEEQAASAKVETVSKDGEEQQWLVIRMPMGKQMFYDPDVQVLVDTRSDKDDGMNVKLVVAVSVSVGVALCAVVAVLSGAVVWRRRKLRDFSASLGAVNFSGEEGTEDLPLLSEGDWQDY